MGLSAKVGSFNTGTGAIGTTVVVNTVGFQPKVIFFWWNGRTGTVDAVGRANHQRGFGVGVSATDRRYITSLSQDTPTSMVTNAMQGNAACIGITTTADAIDGLMDVQSMDAGGFTLVVDDVFTASYRVHYLALGGTDITNVVTGQFTGNGVGGAAVQDITSLAFQPDFIALFGTGQASANNTVRSDSRMMIGAATSSQSGLWSGGSNDGAGTSQAVSYCRVGELIAHLNTGLTGLDDRATFTSFLSNGFRINWDAVAVGGSINFFVAIKGGSFKVGSIMTQTNTSTPIVASSFGFQPKASMLFSHTKAESASGTVADDDELSIGAFTTTTERAAMAMADDDNAATAIVSTAVSHDEVYVNLNANTGAMEGEMDVQSVDSGGFTLIMDDADPSQACVWYMSFGATPLTQTVSGGITPSGALIKLPNKGLTGSITPTGAAIKQAIKAFAGNITPVGSLLKSIGKILSGNNTPSGSLSASRLFIKNVIGTIVPTGTVIKLSTRTLSGDLTSSGSLLKQAQKIFAGTLTSSGSLSASRIFSKILEGVLTLTGTITKMKTVNRVGAITPTGSLNKRTSKTFSGEITPSGVLIRVANYVKALAGTLTSSGTLSKSVNKILSGILSSFGNLTGSLIGGAQEYFVSLSGAITPTGTISKTVAKVFSGEITPLGNLARMATRALSGSVSFSGSLLKRVEKFLAGQLNSIGTLSKTVGKLFSGTLGISGSLSRLTSKLFSGGITPTGDVLLVQLFVKMLEGSLTSAGTLIKSVSKTLTGNISPSGTLNKLVNKFLQGTINFVGSLSIIEGVIEVRDRIYLLGSRVLRVHLLGSKDLVEILQDLSDRRIAIMRGAIDRVVQLTGRVSKRIRMMGKRDV